VKPCELTQGACLNQLDCTRDGKTVQVCADPAPCPFKASGVDSDLDVMRAILARAGVHARSWQVSEYTRGDEVVRGPAIVLVHGSEDAGPYTEYLFNLKGNLMPKGATSFYSRGDVLEQA
jgi:hypothetical protein